MVEITRTPVTEGEAATAVPGGVSPVQVDVTVREVQPIQLRYGASFDTERGVGGVFDVSNHNSLGKARVLGLATKYDASVREGRLYLNQPALRYWPVATTASAYYRQERNPDTRTTDPFNVDRRGLSIQQERELANAYIWTYGYRWERARKFDPLSALRGDWITVSPLTSTFTRETRDEVLDATRGSFLSHAFSYSPSWLGGDDAYIKYYGQFFRYQALQPPRRERFTNEILRPRLVYAAGVRVGLAAGFGGSQLPETERFYAGGSTTLRGFEQNAVGPVRADGIPSGGQALFVVNNEIRFPLVSIVDGVGFVDVGGVFNRVREFRVSDLRQTAGVGLRLRTPWFLIRGDYGVVLDPRPGEARNRAYFSIGQAF
jgi:outer membrane protein insertion porin family